MIGSTGERRAAALARLAAATALMAVLAACGSDSDNSSATGNGTGGDGGDVNISYVPGVSPFAYFDTACRGGKAAAEKFGYNFKYVGVSAYDPTVQTNVLNGELANKPDFLLVSPVDDVANRPAIERFMDAGVPVITVGGTLKDTDGIVAQIATDNYQGGVIAAEYMGKVLNGEGTVATLDIAAGSATVNARVTGFTETMEKEFPNIDVLPVQYGGGDIAGNQEMTRSILLANPDLAGIFGATETNGEGAAAAIKALGKTGEIKVAAFDASSEEIKALKDGTLDFLSVSQPAKQLETAVTYAHAYLTGDKDSIEPETNVPNIGVTRDNVDDPEIQQYFYTDGC